MPESAETVIFGPQARIDAAEIYAYTAEEWGERQAERYLRKLISRLESFAETPALWRRLPWRSDNIFFLRVEHHYAIFLSNDDRMLVLGLIGERMDFEQRVTELLNNENSSN